MESYTGVGLMSGTSLDGLDLCCVEFLLDGENWKYNIKVRKHVFLLQKQIICSSLVFRKIRSATIAFEKLVKNNKSF